MNSTTWSHVQVGSPLPDLHLDLPLSAVILTPAFTKDPYAGHWDVDYVRRLGHPTIFMNTMPLLGIIDRFATEWIGEAAFVRRHSIRMRRPTYADTHIVVSGFVAGKYIDERSDRWGPATLIEIEAHLSSDGEHVCDGRATVALPAEPEDSTRVHNWTGDPS